MIFHDLKAIFMHVERTGGVSLRQYLLNYENNFKRLANTKHLTIQETKEKVGDLWNLYFKFGFVRNPFDRLVSWYHACKQNISWKGSLDTHIQNCKSFDELIYNPHPRILITQFDKVNGIDFIGQFENYNNDVQKLSKILKVPYKKIHSNSSKHHNYKSYYTTETKKIVEKWYKKDLEEFNYEF